MANKKIVFLGIGVLVIIAIVIFLAWFIPGYRRHLKVQEKYGSLSAEEEMAAEKYEEMQENPQVTPEQREATIKKIEAIANGFNFGANDINEQILPTNEIFVQPEVWDETKYSVTFEIYADNQAEMSTIKKKSYETIGQIFKTLYTSGQPIGRVVITVSQKQKDNFVRRELLIMFLTLAKAKEAKIDWNQNENILFYQTLPSAWEAVRLDSAFAQAQIE